MPVRLFLLIFIISHLYPYLEDRVRLPLYFDPVRLREDLARPERSEWIDRFVKQNYAGGVPQRRVR